MKGVIRLMGADFVMQPVAGSLACANDLAEGASYLPVISADLIPRQKPNDGSRNTVGSQSKILNANRTRPRPMPDRRFPPPWSVEEQDVVGVHSEKLRDRPIAATHRYALNLIARQIQKAPALEARASYQGRKMLPLTTYGTARYKLSLIYG
jgi:hypothetical protein